MQALLSVCINKKTNQTKPNQIKTNKTNQHKQKPETPSHKSEPKEHSVSMVTPLFWLMGFQHKDKPKE